MEKQKSAPENKHTSTTKASSLPSIAGTIGLVCGLLYFIHNRHEVIDPEYQTFLTVTADIILLILTFYMPATISSVYFTPIKDENLSRFATGAVYALTLGTYLGMGSPLTLREEPSELVLFVTTGVYVVLGIVTVMARKKRAKYEGEK